MTQLDKRYAHRILCVSWFPATEMHLAQCFYKPRIPL